VLNDTEPHAARAILVGTIYCLILSIATRAFAQSQSACDAYLNRRNSQAQADLKKCMANRGDVQAPRGENLQQICNNQTHAKVTASISRYPVCTGGHPGLHAAIHLECLPGDKSTNSF
jgi:hypothetical protein